MPAMKTSSAVVLLGAAVLSLPACSGTTAQGTPYTIKIDRALETHFPGDLQKVQRVALDVIKDDFQYSVEKSSTDSLQGIIEARTAMGAAVRVELYKYGDAVTRVEVFVGPRGDTDIAHQILDKIEAKLR